MTTEIQTDRYSQIIRRVAAQIGPGGRVVESLTDLFPVIDVERAPPEILALGGWRTAWNTSERPGNVATSNRQQLFNLADSGIVASVTRVDLFADTATAIQGAVELDPIGGTPVRGVFRDSRFGGDRETSLTTTHVDAGIVGAGLRYHLSANLLLSIRDDNGLCVLLPGSGLSFATGGVDIRLTVVWWWRERSAEQSELNF